MLQHISIGLLFWRLNKFYSSFSLYLRMTELKWLLSYGVLVYVTLFAVYANDQEKLCEFYQFFFFFQHQENLLLCTRIIQTIFNKGSSNKGWDLTTRAPQHMLKHAMKFKMQTHWAPMDIILSLKPTARR